MLRLSVGLDLDAALQRDLSAAHAGIKSTDDPRCTRVFNIACQFDTPELCHQSAKATASSSSPSAAVQPGVPCRFRCSIELGPVEQLAAVHVANWSKEHARHSWTAEEDSVILRSPSALVAWEQYRSARSAFPSTETHAFASFPKAHESEAEREVFAARWHELLQSEHYDRRRLLASLNSSRAVHDDDAMRRDDELFARIHHIGGGALTAGDDIRGCALTKAVRRKLEALRHAGGGSKTADAHHHLLDVKGLHSHAAPNIAVFGAMTPDMTIITKTADMATKNEITSTVRCASSAVLAASNLLKQTLAIHALQAKLAPSAAAAAPPPLPSALENRNNDALLDDNSDEGGDAATTPAATSSSGETSTTAACAPSTIPQIVLSEYDDQFGLTPGRDSFGVFHPDNMQRFFNFCEDINSVDLFSEAEAEYGAVREAVERYAVHSCERRLLEARREAMASLDRQQREAEAELKASFQKSFDSVVASIASAFESHLVSTLHAMRSKVDAERERLRNLYDTEEHALLLARSKLGLAATCPDAVANRRSFHGLEARKGAIFGDSREWNTGKQNSDPKEVLTRLLLLTETLQCTQLSQTICAEICSPNSSSSMHTNNHHLDSVALFRDEKNIKQTKQHSQQQQQQQQSIMMMMTTPHTMQQFSAFYGRREFHEYPLLSKETMRVLLTHAPLSQLVEAKQLEERKRKADIVQADNEARADYEQRLAAAQAARSTVAVELHPPPPLPPPSVFSKLADEELLLRRKVRQEQLDSLTICELQILHSKCQVTAARLKRKFRIVKHKNDAAAAIAASASSGKSYSKRGNLYHDQELLLDDEDSDTDDYTFFTEREAKALPRWKRNSTRLAALRGEQVDFLCNDLTTDSDEDQFIAASGVDVLVARLLVAAGEKHSGGGSGASGAARDNDIAKLRVAITQCVNKFRNRRKRHVEDAVFYMPLIDAALKRRLHEQKGPLLNVDGADDPAVQQQQRQHLKSSSLLLLTSSFKRGNRWRIHNSNVSAHDTAMCVSERGSHTVLTALKPLTTYTFFSMFPNEATLRRTCGTSSARVFFQLRVLCGPTSSSSNTRLIGVGFDASSHSRKVPMLSHDPMDPQAGKRQRARELQKRDRLKELLRQEKQQQDPYNLISPAAFAAASPHTKNLFRWNLSSNSRDMCLAVLGDAAVPQLAADEATSLSASAGTSSGPASFGAAVHRGDLSGGGGKNDWPSHEGLDNMMRLLLSEQQTGFVPGMTAGQHPTESSLAADVRRTVGGSAKASGATARKSGGGDGAASAEHDDFLAAAAAVESDSPFYAFTDDKKLPSSQSDFGFSWLSNGTFLLHGAAHALGRDGVYQTGDVLQVALDEGDGTIRLFRNGHEVASPAFTPCPPVELLLEKDSAKKRPPFAPTVPATIAPQRVLERCMWGIGPLIPAVTLLDTAPDHTVDGRMGKTGAAYLSSEHFAIQYKTFKKADTSTTGVAEETAAAAAAKHSSASGSASPGGAAVSAQPQAAGVVELDISKYSLPSVELRLEPQGFDDDVELPRELVEGGYVPFLAAQHAI